MTLAHIDRNDGKDERLVWWEKSVEYQFIREAVDKELFTLTALGGTVEQALGDAIFENAEKLLLIEFKRDPTVLSSERRKYCVSDDDEELDHYYLEAKGALECLPGAAAHALIYAAHSSEQNKGSPLKLRVCEYWRGEEQQAPIQWCAARGVDQATFDQYVEVLAPLRHTLEDSEGGSQSQVVCTGNGLTRSIGLKEYINLRPGLHYLLGEMNKRRVKPGG